MKQAKIVNKNGQEYVETEYGLLGLGLNESRPTVCSFEPVTAKIDLLSKEIAKNLVTSDHWYFGQKLFDSSWITYQNGYGSCAGYGSSSGLSKCRFMNGQGRADLSGDYAYSRVNDNRDRGSGLRENMDSLMRNGCCLRETVPLGGIYRSKYDTTKADAEAARFKGFEFLVADDEASVITLLCMKIPVVIAIHVTSRWREFDSDDVLADCNGVGNHCEHLDDIRWNPVKGRFEFRKASSHGKDYSGDGYCWIYWDGHLKTSNKYHDFFGCVTSIIDPFAELPIPGGNEEDEIKPKPKSKTSIVMMSGDNCGWCHKWKNEVMPRCKSQGWDVMVTNASGTVPRFIYTVDGTDSGEILGFQTFEEVKATLSSMA